MPSTTASGVELSQNISEYLRSRGVPPTQAWLSSFLPTTRTNTALPALQRTALFRLLATDLTASIQTTPSSAFPTNLTSPETRQQHLPGPIPVQILDIEDIGRSRWSQVEALEAIERGETTKGREVIRVLPEENNASSEATRATATASNGPHKLLLQDAEGTKVFAMEMSAIKGVDVSMAIGAKLVLRNVTVARGLLLLEPAGVDVLGGKVEVWDQKWREERKGLLKEKAGMSVDT
ncbi:hypothetical protein MBLNU230_g1445t1 [Neophaeotheca triangularis]